MADFGAWLAAALSVICMVPIRHLLRNIFYTSDGGAGRLSLRSRVVRGPHRRASGTSPPPKELRTQFLTQSAANWFRTRRLVVAYLRAVAPRWHMSD